MSLATPPRRLPATERGRHTARRAAPTVGRADLVGLAVVVVAVVAQHLALHGRGLTVGMDMATQFIPWYGWLGDQVAAGNLPLWNPAVFSGMPSAGDPLSGWGYLPAMVPFTLLDLGAAVHAFLVVQLLVLATGSYLLARALGASVGGAVAAAVAATGSGFVVQRNACCVAFVSVEAWVPWLLLGIDRALATVGARRIGAVALAGVALAQVAAGWPGQGLLYVLLAAGAWFVGRGLARPGGWRVRLRTMAVVGAQLAVAGAGLSAAAVAPRLQVNPATNLAGGYPGQGVDAWHGGWWPADWGALVQPGIWHAGVVTLLLAVAALVVARRDRVAWVLGALVVGALVLAIPAVTPLSAPLLTIGDLDRVLTHAPQRAMIVAYPALAQLVGLGVTRLPRALTTRRRTAWLLTAVLLAALVADLTWSNVAETRRALAAPRNPDLVRRIDPDTFYEPSGAARFLQRQRDRGEIGRYAALTPVPRPDGRVVSASYFFFWHFPSVQRIAAHNHSLLLGLEHVQGYNPVHLARYDALVDAANGRGQDYHVANLFPRAFDGGAFDLLNGRWVVMSAGVDHRDPELVGERIATWPTVYADRQTRVLENPDARPRAWLVGDARQVPAERAVELVASGAVDPGRTALVASAPPRLDPAAGGTATVAGRGTDHLEVAVEATGDALLVVSEVAAPGWGVTVDGEPADLITVDGVLRGVAVPAGRHRVVFTADPTVALAGLATTGFTGLALCLAAWWARRRRTGAP